MADPQQQQPQNEQQQEQNDDELLSDSTSESSSDSDTDSEPDPQPIEDDFTYTRPGQPDPEPEDTTNPETNIKKFAQILKSRRYRKLCEEEEREAISIEEQYDFPKDKENWKEEDLKELWADGPESMLKPGWDPAWADEEDWEAVKEEIKAGRDPPIAPFYLPFRKYYPAIPDNHFDIASAKDVVEELDRIEEFLRWVSYIFPDGSSYEGTVWDDLAHGKGVYVAEQGLVRYEGEWLQNNMEGHGVVEVEIPDVEPIPGSKLEAQMRAEGKIIKRDFLNQEDREWLEMDIEDSIRLTNENYQIPFYENDEWIRQYGEKPEKGRYRYAGQWKHGRMHGCGVYEVNERPIYGRFYFGERVKESAGCDPEISAMHAGIAEVAAAKARMFVNKPDGMVREERGPYGDPQHPYFYEEEDVWQAPGFINQFYEVPDYWKTYVNEVDQEREMWLNSFYKAPLRLPMPAELEYWWENEEPPEFILLNKEPEPDPNDPSKLIYTEDPVILHTPTGRIINYIEDEEHGVRLFWQPEGDVDPSKVKFLPLGFDEFFGKETEVEEKEGYWKRLVCSIENKCKPWFEKIEKWTEEQKKASEIRKQLLEKELELVEAELTLEEVLEDMEESLKQEEKEAEKKVDFENEGEDVPVSTVSVEKKEEKVLPEEKVLVKEEISLEEKALPKEEIDDEDEEEDEDDDDDDTAPSSFGSVSDQKDKKNGSGRSSFSTLSLASCGFLSTVPSMVERSFQAWKEKSALVKVPPPTCNTRNKDCVVYSHVTYQQTFPENINLRLNALGTQKLRAKRGRISSKLKYSKNDLKVERCQGLNWLCAPPEKNSDNILSLHVPFQCLDPYIEIVHHNEECTTLQSPTVLT